MTVLLLLLLGVVGGGCTVVRGDKQKVDFRASDPEHVIVNLDGTQRVTPFSEDLKRKQTYHIIASAPGYETIAFDFQGKVDLAAVLPFALPAGSVMMAADLATGANKDFSRTLTFRLKPTTQPSTQPTVMKEFQGNLYTAEAYDKVVREYQESIRNSAPANPKRPNTRGY